MESSPSTSSSSSKSTTLQQRDKSDTLEESSENNKNNNLFKITEENEHFDNNPLSQDSSNNQSFKMNYSINTNGPTTYKSSLVHFQRSGRYLPSHCEPHGSPLIESSSGLNCMKHFYTQENQITDQKENPVDIIHHSRTDMPQQSNIWIPNQNIGNSCVPNIALHGCYGQSKSTENNLDFLPPISYTTTNTLNGCKLGQRFGQTCNPTPVDVSQRMEPSVRSVRTQMDRAKPSYHPAILIETLDNPNINNLSYRPNERTIRQNDRTNGINISEFYSKLVTLDALKPFSQCAHRLADNINCKMPEETGKAPTAVTNKHPHSSVNPRKSDFTNSPLTALPTHKSYPSSIVSDITLDTKKFHDDFKVPENLSSVHFRYSDECSTERHPIHEKNSNYRDCGLSNCDFIPCIEIARTNQSDDNLIKRCKEVIEDSNLPEMVFNIFFDAIDVAQGLIKGLENSDLSEETVEGAYSSYEPQPYYLNRHKSTKKTGFPLIDCINENLDIPFTKREKLPAIPFDETEKTGIFLVDTINLYIDKLFDHYCQGGKNQSLESKKKGDKLPESVKGNSAKMEEFASVQPNKSYINHCTQTCNVERDLLDKSVSANTLTCD